MNTWYIAGLVAYYIFCAAIGFSIGDRPTFGQLLSITFLVSIVLPILIGLIILPILFVLGYVNLGDLFNMHN